VTKLGRVGRALRARREERGSVIVEAAIIVPLLIMLTFGAIEYGLAFRDSASIASSTRAGARIASALTGDDTLAAEASGSVKTSLTDMTNTKPQMLVIFRANSNGDLFGGGSYTTCTDCFRYNWVNGAWSGPVNPDLWTAAEQKADACNGTLPSVGVYVKAQHTFLTALFGTTKTIDHKTVMRLEPIASGQC
jgi:Flp pilus assembly protein TadG